MTYPRRITLSAIGSALVHLALFTAWIATPDPKTVAASYKRTPMVLNLQPPQKQNDRRLIDVLLPTNEPIAETDLISDDNSKAADVETHDGEELGPRLEETNTYDALDMEPGESPEETIPEQKPEPVELEIAPKASPAQAPEVQPITETSPESFAVLPSIPEPPAENTDPMPILIAELDSERDDPPAVESPPIQIAKALPGKGVDPIRSEAKGRVRDLVTNKGFTSFEALQDELAPYLLNVRRRVERKWNEMLLTRYSGTRSTSVVINCTIDATGKVVSVLVVGEPKNRVFAALCRSIIEEAAPFGPFPFEVPDIYRSKNLEIRWTFHFL